MPSRHSVTEVVCIDQLYFVMLGEPPPDLSVGSCFHAACNRWDDYQGPPGHTGGLVLPAAWRVSTARWATRAEFDVLTRPKEAASLLGSPDKLWIVELEQTSSMQCKDAISSRLRYLWWASKK